MDEAISRGDIPLGAVEKGFWYPFYITDSEGRLVYTSSGLERINNLKRGELVGLKAMDLVRMGRIDHSITEQVLHRRIPIVSTQTWLRLNMEVVVHSVPVIGPTGQIDFVVATIRNDDFNFGDIPRSVVVQENRIVYRSSVMGDLLRKCRVCAPCGMNVLIEGETGTGKGMIARLLHDMSDRRNHPFISVNCGSIPDSLVESELFGYSKGAFTGALTCGKEGFFAAAGRGTLFLDEIESLPMIAQGKLLHVVEDGEFWPVGGGRKMKAECRLVFASNENLSTLVETGRFRPDLYYRISTVLLKVPPLRERMEDVPELARFFLAEFNRQYVQNKQLGSDAIEALLGYDWPGNVRQLKGVVQRAGLFSTGHVVTSDHIINSLDTAPCLRVGERAGAGPVGGSKMSEDAEKERLAAALARHHSTREVARILGMSQSTVVRRIKKYGLRKELLPAQ